MSKSIFANPPPALSAEECYFYHTMDLPGFGTVHGEWDLRGREAEYLGHVPLSGKRVLEMGTASGFLCFFMEKQGADVIAYDLSEKDSWDIVPYARMESSERARLVEKRRAHIAKLNRSFWFAHKAHASKTKVVHGPIYSVPEAIGPVEIVTFTSILLHVRDPFLAMQAAARHARETLIVTEKIQERRLTLQLMDRLGLATMRFLPRAERCEPWETWWSLTPRIIRRFAAVLGFEKATTSYFSATGPHGKTESLFCVVARR